MLGRENDNDLFFNDKAFFIPLLLDQLIKKSGSIDPPDYKLWKVLETGIAASVAIVCWLCCLEFCHIIISLVFL